ncbi:MAG TPA: DUF4229 domain-containing protein [Actinocrinis sp.]|nr:DUF4229 domain-containing protein [Actinocrinis sp.]
MTEQVGEKQTSKAKATNSAKGSAATKRPPATDGAPAADTAPAATGTATATGTVRASSKASAVKTAPASSKASAIGSAPAADTTSAHTSGFETRHAVMRYTTLRLGLFLVALVLVWAVALIFHMDLSSQLSKLTLLAVALLLSSAASFIVLTKQRDAMSAGIVARTQRLSRKFDDAASFEDDEE